MTVQLSEHFSLADITVTSQPFDNTPDADEIENLRLLCEHVLEPIRAHYDAPVHVNSGFRSHLVNTASGRRKVVSTAWGRQPTSRSRAWPMAILLSGFARTSRSTR